MKKLWINKPIAQPLTDFLKAYEITKKAQSADEFMFLLTNGSGVSPTEVFEINVRDLEKLCEKANSENKKVILFSPTEIEKPKSVYELSTMVAEDLISKKCKNYEIIRKI